MTDTINRQVLLMEKPSFSFVRMMSNCLMAVVAVLQVRLLPAADRAANGGWSLKSAVHVSASRSRFQLNIPRLKRAVLLSAPAIGGFLEVKRCQSWLRNLRFWLKPIPDLY